MFGARAPKDFRTFGARAKGLDWGLGVPGLSFDMDLECYPVADCPPEIVPGRPDRDWMDRFAARHPYRCLPLTMANTTGWELLSPVGFSADWDGGEGTDAIRFKPDRLTPGFEELVKSHFGGGVLTFHTGYLFRTRPGWDMIAQGPPNLPKDGIYPLSGLVETDWLPFPFTMNWKFTRTGRIRFEKGEPFCFLTLTPHRVMEEVQPVRRSMNADEPLRRQYEAWTREREAFNRKLGARDPEALREAWQRFYFKGELPEETGAPPEDHINKRRLKPLKFGL